MKVLLSIKPEYATKIFNNEKRYEYRKTIFKREVNSVVVYVTKPVGKIIGEFFIEEIIHDDPQRIWKNTKKFSGISEDKFDEYFKNKSKGYALKIGKVRRFRKPIDPKKMWGAFTPPQSFCYVDDDFLSKHGI